jgi:hypothetical protein
MTFYDVDILEIATGEVRRTPMLTGWNEHSAALYRTTACDCNLAGYRQRGYFTLNAEGQIIGTWTFHPEKAHESIAYEWREANGGCDHRMPPTRMKALRAHLSTGEIIELP